MLTFCADSWVILAELPLGLSILDLVHRCGCRMCSARGERKEFRNANSTKRLLADVSPIICRQEYIVMTEVVSAIIRNNFIFVDFIAV